MFKMDVRTIWQWIQNCYPIIMHARFTIDRTILKCLNFIYGRAYGHSRTIEKYRLEKVKQWSFIKMSKTKHNKIWNLMNVEELGFWVVYWYFVGIFEGNLFLFTFNILVGRLHKVTSGVRKKGVNTTLKQKELPYGLLNP